MPDQPALEPYRIGFHMELQRQHARPHAECLIWGNRRGGQPRGAGREIESVAVPVQHLIAGGFQMPQA